MPQQSQEVRVLIVTAKVLQLCADIFAVFGIFLFAFIYFNHYDDRALDALKDPFFLVAVIIPFTPTIILATQAAKKRKRIRALLEQDAKTS